VHVNLNTPGLREVRELLREAACFPAAASGVVDSRCFTCNAHLSVFATSVKAIPGKQEGYILYKNISQLISFGFQHGIPKKVHCHSHTCVFGSSD